MTAFDNVFTATIIGNWALQATANSFPNNKLVTGIYNALQSSTSMVHNAIELFFEPIEAPEVSSSQEVPGTFHASYFNESTLVSLPETIQVAPSVDSRKVHFVSKPAEEWQTVGRKSRRLSPASTKSSSTSPTRIEDLRRPKQQTEGIYKEPPYDVSGLLTRGNIFLVLEDCLDLEEVTSPPASAVSSVLPEPIRVVPEPCSVEPKSRYRIPNATDEWQKVEFRKSRGSPTPAFYPVPAPAASIVSIKDLRKPIQRTAGIYREPPYDVSNLLTRGNPFLVLQEC